MQMDPVVRARRKALREAQAWLLAQAQDMNDPKARQVLNSAALAFGAQKLRGFSRETGQSEHDERMFAERRESRSKSRSPKSGETGHTG